MDGKDVDAWEGGLQGWCVFLQKKKKKDDIFREFEWCCDAQGLASHRSLPYARARQTGTG
jgi:hypothetical protein